MMATLLAIYMEKNNSPIFASRCSFMMAMLLAIYINLIFVSKYTAMITELLLAINIKSMFC